MKKILVIAALLVGFATTSSAQFEEGKLIINPSVTGLGLSYSLNNELTLGLGTHVGYFLHDNFAVLGNVEGRWSSPADYYTLGAGARYYFDQVGIFLGGTADVEGHKYKYSDFKADFGLGIEAGYAYFISRNVTVEPSIYYKWRFRSFDNSKFGVRLGFGLFF